jgi:Cu2+-exporting ATPase
LFLPATVAVPQAGGSGGAPAQAGDEASAKGQTVVYLLQDERPVAGFALADLVRPGSQQAVDRLREMEVEVSMITADSEAVADDLGIEHYFAQVLLEHEDQKVSQLQAQGVIVAINAQLLRRVGIGTS